MPNEIDDVLDRCRHGKSAGEFCTRCDLESVDLRDRGDVDLTDEPAAPEEISPQQGAS